MLESEIDSLAHTCLLRVGFSVGVPQTCINVHDQHSTIFSSSSGRIRCKSNGRKLERAEDLMRLLWLVIGVKEVDVPSRFATLMCM